MLGLLSVLKKYKNTRFSSEMIRKQRKLRGDLVQKSPTPTNGVEPRFFSEMIKIREILGSTWFQNDPPQLLTMNQTNKLVSKFS